MKFSVRDLRIVCAYADAHGLSHVDVTAGGRRIAEAVGEAPESLRFDFNGYDETIWIHGSHGDLGIEARPPTYTKTVVLDENMTTLAKAKRGEA